MRSHPSKSVPDFLEEMTGDPSKFLGEYIEEKPPSNEEDECDGSQLMYSSGEAKKIAPDNRRRILPPALSR